MKHAHLSKSKLGLLLLFFLFSIQSMATDYISISIAGPSNVEVGIEYTYTVTVNSANLTPSITNVNLTELQISSPGIMQGSQALGGIDGLPISSTATNSFTTNIPNSQWTRTFKIIWGDISQMENEVLTVIAKYNYNNNGTSNSVNLPAYKNVGVKRLNNPTLLSNIPPQNCCTNAITFTAANVPNADIFNWTLSAGTLLSQTGNTALIIPPVTGNFNIACTVKRGAAHTNYSRESSSTIQRSNPAGININTSASTLCVGNTTSLSLIGSTCGLQNIVWSAPNCTITGQGSPNPSFTPNSSFANNTALQISVSANYLGGCGTAAASKSFTVYRADAITIPAGSLSSVNAPGWTNLNQIRRITFASSNTNGATVSITPETVNLWQYYYYNSGTGQIKNYQYNTTASVAIPVTIYYSNPCKQLQSSYNYTLPKPIIVPGQIPNPMLKAANLATTTNEETKPSHMLYPNPTHDQVTLSWQKPQDGQMRLYDMQGKLLVSKKFKESKEEILYLNSYQLPQGMYILIVDGSELSFTEKFNLLP